MKIIGRKCLLSLILSSCPSLFGQQNASLPDYQASVRTLESQAVQWRATIDSVKIDDLPVAYSTGKAYEQGITSVIAQIRP